MTTPEAGLPVDSWERAPDGFVREFSSLSAIIRVQRMGYLDVYDFYIECICHKITIYLIPT